MDLGLTEEQEMLKNFARDFLEKECPESLVRQMEEGFRQKKDVNPLEGMLSAKAVQVGETWSFDARPLLLAWPKPPQVRIDYHFQGGAPSPPQEYKMKVGNGIRGP